MLFFKVVPSEFMSTIQCCCCLKSVGISSLKRLLRTLVQILTFYYIYVNIYFAIYSILFIIFWHTYAYGDIPVWFLPLFCGSFPSKNHLNIHLYFLLVLSQFHFHICLFNLSGMYFSIYYKVSIWSVFIFFYLSQMIARSS